MALPSFVLRRSKRCSIPTMRSEHLRYVLTCHVPKTVFSSSSPHIVNSCRGTFRSYVRNARFACCVPRSLRLGPTVGYRKALIEAYFGLFGAPGIQSRAPVSMCRGRAHRPGEHPRGPGVARSKSASEAASVCVSRLGFPDDRNGNVYATID